MAGASLLIDYVLTVAVSVAAGVAAITSAFPDLYDQRVLLGVITVAAIAVVNLRGVRESGKIFAVPTYLFIVSFLGLIVLGLAHVLWWKTPMTPPPVSPPAAVVALTPFLILRAFASGCVALTGVEAISNGVMAFRKPEAENAKRTMVWMAAIMLTFFAGITFLAREYGVLPREGETVVSQLARAIVGTGPFYYVIQGATALILLLAANTSFAGFPRLSSLIARDGFLPANSSTGGTGWSSPMGSSSSRFSPRSSSSSSTARPTPSSPSTPSVSSSPSLCRRRGWSDTTSASERLAGDAASSSTGSGP